jgi:hypothetical protein
MGAVLCQVDPKCKASLQVEHKEAAGGPCIFDKTIMGPHLVPILFISCLYNNREQNYKATTG